MVLERYFGCAMPFWQYSHETIGGDKQQELRQGQIWPAERHQWEDQC
jgi:hypothetical protein